MPDDIPDWAVDTPSANPVATSTANQTAVPDWAQEETTSPPPNFASRVGTDLSKRNQIVQDAVDKYQSGQTSFPETLLTATGKGVAGSVNDIMGEAAKGVYNTLPLTITDPINAGAKYLRGTKSVQQDLDTASRVGSAYSQFAKDNPRTANALESAGDIVGAGAALFPAGRAIAAAGDAAATGADLGTRILKYSPPPGPTDAQSKAKDIISSALQAERITPQQAGDMLAKAQSTNPEATSLDALVQEKNGVLTGGRNFIGLTKAAATFPGDASSMSGDVVSRAAGMRDRVNGAFDQYLSSTPYYTADKDFVQQMKGAAPAYEKAFAGGSTAPLEDQFGQHFAELSKQDKLADQQINAANNKMTQAQAQLSRAGSNVYGVNSGNDAVRSAQADMDAATRSKQDIASQKQDALTRLQNAQQDRANGVRGGIWNSTVAQALQQPEIQAGIQKGLQLERLDAFSEGRPFNPKEYAVTGYDVNGNPIIGSVPNMRLLDAGKRGLDAMIQAEEKPTGGYTSLGRSLIKANKTYVSALDDANPDYAIARKTYGSPAAQRQALQQGRDFTNMDPEEISQFMSDPKTSDAEKRAFAIGVRRNLADTMDQNSSDTRALTNLWKNSYQKRLAAMSPDTDAFNQFAQKMNDERQMTKVNQIHTGGSDTMMKNNYGQTIEGSSPVGVAGRFAHAFFSPGSASISEATRFLDGALQKRAAGMSHDTAAEIMKYMTSKDPTIWYNLNAPQKSLGGATYKNGGKVKKPHSGVVIKPPKEYPALKSMRQR